MQHIHAALPFLDAQLMCFSLLASWWQARKNTINWPLWVVVNLIYIGEYLYKGLLLTSPLYAVLAILALIGWRDWHRAERAQFLVTMRRIVSLIESFQGGGRALLRTENWELRTGI